MVFMPEDIKPGPISSTKDQPQVDRAGSAQDAARELTYGQAVREALRLAMQNDPKVFLLGEDIGVYGGAFGITDGLLAEFGPEMVRDTPISEAAIAGADIGAAPDHWMPLQC